MLKRYFRYTMPSMLAMTGFSLYILADTFFISLAEGAKGITVLNLCLPYYDIIYAVGMLIGIGSATRFSIESAQGLPQSEEYFTRS
ncbi:MAG: MATE family efflux transporter, partial [Firmicutes bacterium]|nr:MATE family efflux transporter [Bacillota bacterium]